VGKTNLTRLHISRHHVLLVSTVSVVVASPLVTEKSYGKVEQFKYFWKSLCEPVIHYWISNCIIHECNMTGTCY